MRDSVSQPYAARLHVDLPDRLGRVSWFFRLVWIIPIAIVAGALSGSASETDATVTDGVTETTARAGGGTAGALFAATVLMIVFRQRSPDTERDLNRWLPLVKWVLAFPHYLVLAGLSIGGVVVWVTAWFAVLFTGRYPRPLFDYLVGVGRWSLRVQACEFLLVTDRYPPFSLR